ncbi:MAG: hypothetical protein N2258_04010 [Brevinematales bacterium]|nr:hypothetical protein [Brevinematales bacterium]
MKFYGALMILLLVLMSCSSQPSSGGSSGGSVSSSTSSVSSSTSSVFTPVVALNLDFENGQVPSSYYTAFGTVTPSVVDFAGRKCFKISGQTSSSYAQPASHSVEIQFDLAQPVDMSGEDFVISFDYYIPATYVANLYGFQFSFWKVPGYTPIYSAGYGATPNSWNTIYTNVDTISITYSGFSDNPGGWVGMNKIRFQFSPKTGTSPGMPVEFYLDNIVVSNIQK